MLSKSQYNVLLALGGLAVLATLANGLLFAQNRSLQSTLEERQRFIAQTGPLQGLYNDIAKTLAQLGIKSNDREVLNLLASQGLTVTVNGASAGAPESSSNPSANLPSNPGAK